MYILMKMKHWLPWIKKYLKKNYNRRLDKIEELSGKINYDDLKYTTQSSGGETDFSEVNDPVKEQINI